MPEPQLVIATFNTEWRRAASRDAAIIRERLEGCDIVCLTEAYQDFFANEGYLISPPFVGEGHDDGRRKVLLWSKKPWATEQIGQSEWPSHFLAGTTETDLGTLSVYGVVIPYRFSDVRYGKPKRKVWEKHLEFLQALDELLPERPERSIILGDFNQRVPAKYQPQRVGLELERVLLRRFELATGGVIPDIGKQAIDHVCLSSDLTASDVHGLSNSRPGGGEISDHFGIRVRVTRR